MILLLFRFGFLLWSSGVSCISSSTSFRSSTTYCSEEYASIVFSSFSHLLHQIFRQVYKIPPDISLLETKQGKIPQLLVCTADASIHPSSFWLFAVLAPVWLHSFYYSFYYSDLSCLPCSFKSHKILSCFHKNKHLWKIHGL